MLNPNLYKNKSYYSNITGVEKVAIYKWYFMFKKFGLNMLIIENSPCLLFKGFNGRRRLGQIHYSVCTI